MTIRRREPEPQRIARLIGGPADRHTCTIPPKSRQLMITLVSGQPEVLNLAQPDTAREILDRARGDWHAYEQIRALPADEHGLLGFRHARDLPAPIEEFLESIQSANNAGDSHSAWWSTLENLLSAYRIGPDPPSSQ